jgi:hypothetical protein
LQKIRFLLRFHPCFCNFLYPFSYTTIKSAKHIIVLAFFCLQGEDRRGEPSYRLVQRNESCSPISNLRMQSNKRGKIMSNTASAIYPGKQEFDALISSLPKNLSGVNQKEMFSFALKAAEIYGTKGFHMGTAPIACTILSFFRCA